GITSSLEGHRCRKEAGVRDLRLWSSYPDVGAEFASAKAALKALLEEREVGSVLSDVALRLQRGVAVERSTAVRDLRARKAPDEQERIRVAVRHADAGQRFARELCEAGAGLTEFEVAAEIDYFLRRRGVQETSFTTIVASGPNAAFSHHSPGRRRLRDGDSVICDFGAFWKGYCSDITRTYFVGGSPTPKWRKRYALVLEANERSRAALRHGAVAQDVDGAGRNFLGRSGVGNRFVHGTGHGFGLEVHEWPSLTYGQKTVLEKGMCVTVEPGLYFPRQGGIRIEDDLLVTRSGCETLTHAAKALY
ncbi:MAG TPA: M24 family metallopeptidase, partial [Candidatus Poseidoniales archaeon]|nr:M24 family metallopeptidase [Candidatus Poseidoniales archaeon]